MENINLSAVIQECWSESILYPIYSPNVAAWKG